VKLARFRVDVGEDVIAGIRTRLRDARLPVRRGEGWEHGASIEYLEHLRSYWLDEFDWASAQERLNTYPQFTATIEGLRIHFYWVRGTAPKSRPLVLTHGWPGSVVEFLPAIKALSLAHSISSSHRCPDSASADAPMAFWDRGRRPVSGGA
jgi:hypothetical protein